MTARVICFASAKGGTGKTVISASFAQFLKALNKKVLLIDTDADTNGLTIFYLEKMIAARTKMAKIGKTTAGIFEIYENNLPTPINIDECVDFIPAIYVMEQTAKINEERFKNSLEHTINSLREKYDYIFLDAQAGSDVYAEIAIKLADDVLIISEYDPISIAGIDRLINIFTEIMPYEKRWILYNKVLPELAKKIGDLRVVERILSPIPLDMEVIRAFGKRRLAIDTEKGNAHTMAIMKSISSLFGDEIYHEIENWKRQKSNAIREPILNQTIKIEKELIALEETVIEISHELQELKQKPNRYLMYIYIMLAIVTTYFLIIRSIIDIYYIYEIYIISIIASFALLTIIIRELVQKRVREQEKNKKMELEILNSKIEELKIRYQKYRILIDSDIEKILEQYET